MCLELCEYSKDGECHDGGPGADFDDCAFGTDCEVWLPSTNALSKKKKTIVVLRLNGVPSDSTFFFFFTNTLYPPSDGRTVAHAQAT
jgi:hypothetical protein